VEHQRANRSGSSALITGGGVAAKVARRNTRTKAGRVEEHKNRLKASKNNEQMARPDSVKYQGSELSKRVLADAYRWIEEQAARSDAPWNVESSNVKSSDTA
jgi:hypothetical protein